MKKLVFLSILHLRSFRNFDIIILYRSVALWELVILKQKILLIIMLLMITIEMVKELLKYILVLLFLFFCGGKTDVLINYVKYVKIKKLGDSKTIWKK